MKKNIVKTAGYVVVILLSYGLFSAVILAESGFSLWSLGIGFLLIWVFGNIAYHEIKKQNRQE